MAYKVIILYRLYMPSYAASWMVLSKAHAAIHAHLVPMLWHFAFVPISCMLLPVLAKLMIPGRKKDLVASH